VIALADFPPPPAFDHPFTGPGVIVRLAEPVVERVCRELGVDVEPTRAVYSCSWWVEGGCLEILPKVGGSITIDDASQLRRVEDANCNGWPRRDRK
jgi:hypothetical protein